MPPERLAHDVEAARERRIAKALFDLASRLRLRSEVTDQTKEAFLAGAAALLFPVDWPEPFGLVMIEAMACGTPVIAYRHGSVPEVVDDGITGFVVDNEMEAVEAIGRLDELDRRKVRARFEQRFTARRMADEYFGHYTALLSAFERRKSI